MAVLGSSATVTLVAVLGGTGILPSAATDHPAAARAGHLIAAPSPTTPPSATTRGPQGPDRAADRPAAVALRPGRAHSGISSPGSPDAVEVRDRTTRDAALPLRSGEGRRIVFSQNRQRVWLVGAHDRVRRTYPVSGSVTDNLAPGTYAVYSRSEQAWGIDDSGTMKYFVRFAHGQNAAIGFHDIPIKDGHLLQSVADLGTPQSHGCIRQRRTDAIALWRFAPVGTTVVVV
nr:L,D-transpeptidase [Nocardioides panaciterrulae]